MFAVRPVFFATYRDIYDALFSAKLRVTRDFMHNFLRSRGIVLGNNADRETLVATIAAYAYESEDLDILCDQLEVHSRSDRVSSIDFNKVVDSDVINRALKKVRERRSDRYENIDFDNVEGGRSAISIDYFDIQESRTALRQHLPKHGEIEFLKIGDSTRIRFPGAERVSEFAEQIVEEIEKIVGKFDRKVINLATFSKLQRTNFFRFLIDQVDGYKTVDVLKVSLDRDLITAELSDTDSAAEGDGGDEDVVDEVTESRSESIKKREAEKEVKAILKRASLAGSGVLHARELKTFLESGFYISRIIWKLQPKSKKNGDPSVELEALFERPAEGLGFRYMVRGIYSYKTNRTFSKTKRKAQDVEKYGLLEKLERAAQQAYGLASKPNEKGVE
jgi:hypothetical protein